MGEDVQSTQHHREIGRLKLAEYEKEKCGKLLDITAAHSGVWALVMSSAKQTLKDTIE